MEILLDDIDEEDGFNPRATIRKLRINIANSEREEPFISIYDDIEDVYVDSFSDFVYFMTPTHVISYLYGSNARYVTFEVQNTENNVLLCKIIDPQNLIDANLQK